MEQIGVSRLHLPNGTIRHNQILIFENKKLGRYFPLTEEIAFTKWIGGDYYLNPVEHSLY